ncbi:hypothetical protein BDA99DRAFT_512274 [Phascolomyces articulosus]|uniref:Uncharacterized protein n=1 Tax=Phascolomyces articulosus TaxID=60185 RepID=A0AAD5K7V0_9FUNG|nr:hypothetical protein BDA99DRAFT_512274 [Phascolomyces articulosus]
MVANSNYTDFFLFPSSSIPPNYFCFRLIFPLCSTSETIDFFFVFCPPKTRVWKTVSQRCNSDWSISDINTFICTLQQPQRTQHKPNPILHISIAIYCMWRHHWRLTYDQKPFFPGIITTNIQQLTSPGYIVSLYNYHNFTRSICIRFSIRLLLFFSLFSLFPRHISFLLCIKFL